MGPVLRWLQTASWWHLVWVTVGLAQILTLALNTLQSVLWWGFVSRDLLIIGTIDALVVALIVGTLVVFLVKRIRDVEREAHDAQARLVADLQGALATIKTLRGIIPICAGCKKIRNDRGYWTQVEHYVREHTEAEFSHGLCPSCATTLYPDLEGPQGARLPGRPESAGPATPR